MASQSMNHCILAYVPKGLQWVALTMLPLILPITLKIGLSACSAAPLLSPQGKVQETTSPSNELQQVQGAERRETGGNSKAPQNGTDQADLDQENIMATPPTPIAGAFLTSWCEKVVPGPASKAGPSTNTLVGCVVLDHQNQVFEGKVQLTALDIDTDYQKAPLTGQPIPASQESYWHQIFMVKGLGTLAIKRFRVRGKVDGNPIDILRLAASRTRQELTGACENIEIKSEMYSSVMDFRSSLNLLNLGSPPVEVFGGTLFGSKDSILLESALGRNIVHSFERNNSLQSNCPQNWYLTITDNNNKFLSEYHLLEQRSFTLPPGSFKMWLGYRDSQIGLYPTHEGGSLYPGKSSQSTNGCHFKFVHTASGCQNK